jgi:hypothetical protein
MRPVLYTCITAMRDPIPRPVPNDRLDHVLYIDPADLDLTMIDVRPWTIRPLVWQHPTDPVRTARWHKHNPLECFPDHEYSIWMDASHRPVTDISWFPDWFLHDADIACFPHFARISIEQEAEEVIKHGADDEDTVRAQLARYRKAGFTSEFDTELYETGVLVRRHNRQIDHFSREWWREIVQGSRRDQLSFTYCLWRRRMRCVPLAPGYANPLPPPGRNQSNPYFAARSHLDREEDQP